jgi:hypothetical protein
MATKKKATSKKGKIRDLPKKPLTAMQAKAVKAGTGQQKSIVIQGG